MAFNCCSNCLPLLLEYHSSSLDLERKLQMQVIFIKKIELSKLQFEKQIRDLASLSISQATAPDSHNSNAIFSLNSDQSHTQTLKSNKKFQKFKTTPLLQEKKDFKLQTEVFFIETPEVAQEKEKTLKNENGFKLDLVPDKEISLKSSLSELRSSLNSLISSAEFFGSSANPLKKSSEFTFSERTKAKDDSLFTFQEELNNIYINSERDLQDSKKSSLMSPLRESELKNSKEGSSGLKVNSIEKPQGTCLSDILDSSEKPSSGFNKAFLTLDELQHSSVCKNLFELPSTFTTNS